MARPGIMLYFDILEPIRVLPDADKGRLLVAMLEYGQRGTLPQFDGDLGLTLAWGFVKPKIDKDSEEYNKTVLKRQYATFCRDRKKKGEPEISFDEWLMTVDNQSYQMVSHDTKCYPTTSTTPTSSTNTSTSITTAAAATTTETEIAAAAIKDSKVNVVGGELGRNVVFLSDAQISDLLDRMGIETFDYYMDKLSDFIIKNDAHVKNHYDTILKWWQEDGAIPKREKADKIPKGASGKLGQAELDNIQRMLSDN